MPKFENTLPDESRWNVVNYLRTDGRACHGAIDGVVHQAKISQDSPHVGCQADA
jgi:hypothetical protein